jgi:hypothetical protein
MEAEDIVIDMAFPLNLGEGWMGQNWTGQSWMDQNWMDQKRKIPEVVVEE